jgi:hypothetical protein
MGFTVQSLRTRAYIHALGDCVRLLEQLPQNVPWLHVAAAASPGDGGEPVTDPSVEIGDVVLAGDQDPGLPWACYRMARYSFLEALSRPFPSQRG